jgi:hypothetical protein
LCRKMSDGSGAANGRKVEICHVKQILCPYFVSGGSGHDYPLRLPV